MSLAEEEATAIHICGFVFLVAGFEFLRQQTLAHQAEVSVGFQVLGEDSKIFVNPHGLRKLLRVVWVVAYFLGEIALS